MSILLNYISFLITFLQIISSLSFTFKQSINVTQNYNQLIISPKNQSHEIFVGYLPVGPNSAEGMIFYQLVTANGISLNDSKSQNIPIIAWFQGGPGCSSWFGNLYEFGPYKVSKNLTGGFQLTENNNTWALNYHLLFIDQPVGVGYSTLNNFPYLPNNTKQGSIILQQALNNFYDTYPQLKANDLYLFGESYAGHYVPSLAATLLANKSDINLKGIGVGDGLTDGFIQFAGYNPFFYSAGIISTGKFKQNKKYISQVLEDTINENYEDGIEKLAKVQVDANEAQVQIDDYRAYDGTNQSKEQNQEQAIIEEWLVNNSTLNFMGQPPNAYQTKEEQENFLCNSAYFSGFTNDIMESYAQNYSIILQNIKVIIYSGQYDANVASNGAEDMINQFEWQYLEEWQKSQKQTWTIDNQVVGWVKFNRNLAFALFNKAGHMVKKFSCNQTLFYQVPYYQPYQSLQMVKNFIDNNQNWQQ